MFSTPVFLLFINLAFVASKVVVPYINIDYNFLGRKFELSPSDKGYKLLFRNYDGSLQEDVKEIAPGELEVKGEYSQYLSNGLSVEVIYEAGRNGYVAKYRIYQIMAPMGKGASAATLKSTVG